jgi:arylsulfatase A-like enzyme
MRVILGAIAGGGLGALLGLVYALFIVAFQEHYLQQGLSWLALRRLLEVVLQVLLSAAAVGALATLPLVVERGKPSKTASEETPARREEHVSNHAGQEPRPALAWLSMLLAVLASAVAIGRFAFSGNRWQAYLAGHSALDMAIDFGAIAISGGLAGLAIGWLVRRPIPAFAIFPVASIVLIAWLVPSWGPRPTGPNLLLISVDTLRADRLSSYGYANGATAHIEALARSGAVWESAIASAPITLVATATLMTGLDPGDHGVRFNGYYRLGAQHVTLAEILANQGYHTGAVIGNFALDHSFLIDQGFDTYDDAMTQIMGAKRKRKERRGGHGGWWGEFRRKHPAQRFAEEITTTGLEWLRSNDGRPFFLWLHYMDPHKPYEPPPEFEKFEPYDGEVAYVDSQIGALLEGMKALQLDPETLVVFVSDHGESLGEHDYTGHVKVLYNQTLHVPLIMRWPGRIPAGTRISRPIAGREIQGEILRVLAGGSVTSEDSGSSAAPGIDADWRAYAETFYYKLEMDQEPIRAMTDGRWKYLYQRDGIEELYDLSSDPSEINNIVTEAPDRASSFRAELEAWDHGEADAPMDIDEATREKLKALGYIN